MQLLYFQVGDDLCQLCICQFLPCIVQGKPKNFQYLSNWMKEEQRERNQRKSNVYENFPGGFTPVGYPSLSCLLSLTGFITAYLFNLKVNSMDVVCKTISMYSIHYSVKCCLLLILGHIPIASEYALLCVKLLLKFSFFRLHHFLHFNFHIPLWIYFSFFLSDYNPPTRGMYSNVSGRNPAPRPAVDLL